jgi:hypothetical protein
MSKPPRQFLKAPAPHDQQATAGAADLGQTGMSVTETAQYISEFAAELSFLAREARLDLLTYLLDMVRLEAIRTLQVAEKDR